MTVTVFGYLILINKQRFKRFYFSIYFLVIVSIEKIYQCLTAFPNTSKFVKNTSLRIVFSTIFPVFGNSVKHGLSCLTYHFQFF